ncbi:MAG TPA: molybdopterin-dependent oxidoreductase [Kofleriaceae bacterium]|nr:molybdopterin-dependent oxidoreductase [Kofleriaceae bacterium]
MAATKTLCTFCGVVDQVTVDEHGVARGTGSLGACVKGMGYFRERMRMDSRSAERFTSPMLRTPYGWESVSWDYAIDMVADTILADRQEYGRDALAFYGVGQMCLESLWITKRFFQGHLGTNNICSNAEQCLSNNAGGHELVFGNEGPFSCYDDYLDAETIVFYGHNPAANHPTIFDRYIRKNRDAVKVVVDPRRTDTVQIFERDSPNNIHLPIPSGGDVLLNSLIARTLLDEGGIDDAYVKAHVEPRDLADFLAFLRGGPFTFDEAIPRLTPDGFSTAEMAARIRRVCEAWKRTRMVTTSSVGINQTVGSTGVASILNLHLLTGNLGLPGRGHVRLAGQSNASGELALGYSGRLLPFRMRVTNPEHRKQMASIWGLAPWRISPRQGLPVASFATSPQLRTLFVFGTNPARNFPNLARWREKMMDLCVVYVDSYYNPEILEYVDIVLPARTKHEIDGVFLNGERRLQGLRRVAEPPFEAWSDVRIVCSVALRIAERLRERPEPPPQVPEDAPDERADELAAAGNLDLSPDELERDFRLPVDAVGEQLAEPIWEQIRQASHGFYNEFIDGDGRPITLDRIHADEGVQWGGVRRYHRRAGAGDDRAPLDSEDPRGPFPGIRRDDRHRATLHVPAPERLVPFTERTPEKFTLITGRGAMGEGVRQGNVALFNSSTATGRDSWPEENQLYMAPSDAARLELGSGDRVTLRNQFGAIQCPVEVTGDMPAGHIYLTFHPDHRGTHPNFLTDSDNIDPVTWQPLLKDTQVEVIPVREARPPGAR